MMITFLLSSFFFSPQSSVYIPDVIRMMDGRIVVGEITEHDLDGLLVVHAKDDGEFRLAWSDLFPGEADRLRASFGYKSAVVMPQVEADRLYLVNGDSKVGIILQRTEGYLDFRQGAITSKIPRNRLAAPPEKVMVDATEAYTPEQFHFLRSPQCERIATSRSGKDEEDKGPQCTSDGRIAMEHFEFSLELELVFSLDRAHQHLQLAQSMIENNLPLEQRIEVALVRIATSLEHRDELDELNKIRQLVYRERFSEARLALDEFAETRVDSPLWEDYLRVEESFESKRNDGLLRYLKKHWYIRASSLIKKQSLQRGISVQSLQNWAETTLPELIRQAMAQELQSMKEGLDEGEVAAIWVSRLESRPKRHQAGFGSGSWILGEDRARAGLKADDHSDDDGKTAAQKELESRFRDYLKNLERTRQAAGVSSEASPEDWWKSATASSRFQWLLAYYAEFSGDYVLVSVRFDNCSTCNGAGIFETVDQNNPNNPRPKRRKCGTCQGVGVRRGIYFK